MPLQLDVPKSPLRRWLELFAISRVESGGPRLSKTDGIGTASRTPWKLLRAVALLNRIFTTLGVEKGFDFLGYHLWPDRIMVAQATVERFLARVTRLYEQEQGRPLRSAPLGS